jgi:hypothetical protein
MRTPISVVMRRELLRIPKCIVPQYISISWDQRYRRYANTIAVQRQRPSVSMLRNRSFCDNI